MPRAVDIGLRNQMLALSREGISQKVIARRMNVRRETVNRILRKHATTGTLKPSAPPGPSRKTTFRQDRILYNLARRDRFKSARALRSDMRRHHDVRISRQTVNRRLVERGYRARRPTWKPKLTGQHRARRLAWAREHQRLTPAHWRHVVFADESRFVLYPKDGRIRVRRLAAERNMEQFRLPKVASGGGSVHVWAAFSSEGKSTLKVLEQNVNGAVYRDILEENMIPWAQGLYGRNFRFQDDNAPAHRARLVMDFLARHDILTLQQPSCSPDCNPIEHLWDDLGRAVRRRALQPTNLRELGRMLTEEWDRIPQHRLRTLVDSMPRRLAEIRRVRGDHTRY